MFGNEKPNTILKIKMEYAISMNQLPFKCMSVISIMNEMVTVLPCGLVIDKANPIFGATPDGKVVHYDDLGILDVKCSEQYKDVNPKNICLMSKNHALFMIRIVMSYI